MADHNTEIVAGLIRGILDDVRDLIREELAFARTELREELSSARAAGAAFGAAAVTAVIGSVLLFIAIGGAIANFLAWPTWAGYGIVAVLLLIAGAVLAVYGRGRLSEVRALPKTTETVKENLAWMKGKSVER